MGKDKNNINPTIFLFTELWTCMACNRVIMVIKFITQILEWGGLVNSVSEFANPSVYNMQGINLKGLQLLSLRIQFAH